MFENIQTNQSVYDLQSGVRLFITPLTVIGQAHFLKLAIDLEPDPDPAPYEVPLENALIEGDKRSAMNDPEYVKLVAEAQARRAFVHQNLLFDAMVDVPNRDQLLSQYCKVLDHTRAAHVRIGAGLTAPIQSDFVRLLYISLATMEEIKVIIKLIVRLTPLEPGEVIEGLKFFRGVELQRHQPG